MLPETLSIHLYTGAVNPEFIDGLGISEIKNRLNQLAAICTQYGYLPNFANTEYGFSPTVSTTYGPLPKDPLATDEISPSEYTQAVYYLRSTLIYSTMRYADGVEWEKHFYFQHPRNGDDTGFHNQPSGGNYYGTDRDIRYLSRKLYGDADINIDAEDKKIWIPITTTPDVLAGDRLAYCGWSNDAETTYWLAIWRYKQIPRYYKPTGAQRSVTVDGNFVDSITKSVHQFDFTLLPDDVFETQNSSLAQTNWNSPSTTITVSDVTENPTFIKFVKN